VAGWISALAVVPVLVDPAQLLIEHLVMADIVAMFLMVTAFAVALVRQRPQPGRTGPIARSRRPASGRAGVKTALSPRAGGCPAMMFSVRAAARAGPRRLAVVDA